MDINLDNIVGFGAVRRHRRDIRKSMANAGSGGRGRRVLGF